MKIRSLRRFAALCLCALLLLGSLAGCASRENTSGEPAGPSSPASGGASSGGSDSAPSSGSDGGSGQSDSRPNPLGGLGSDAQPEPEVELAPDTDTNLSTAAGRFAYDNGALYFVQPGMDCDGSASGHPDSENIYRLRDGASAPELIVAVPACFYDEIAQTTVTCLVPRGDWVYYVADGYGETGSSAPALCRTAVTDGRTETLAEDVLGVGSILLPRWFRAGDTLYFQARRWVPEEDFPGFAYDWKQADLRTGAVTDFAPLPELPEDQLGRIVGVSGNGWVYYTLTEAEEYNPFGVYRISVKGGKPQEVIPINEEIQGISFVGGFLLYMGEDNDVIRLIDPETGTVRAILREEELKDLVNLNITPEGIYLLMEDGLDYLDFETGEIARLLELDSRRDLVALALCGDRYCFLDEDLLPYAMERTGRILSPSTLGPRAVPEYEMEVKTENGWSYKEFAACVKVVGYEGSGTDLTVPAAIGGKPVTMVGLSVKSDAPEGSVKLTVPEGVVSCTAGGKCVGELWLPSTLRHMNYRGFPNSFNLGTAPIVHYNGTVAQWEALCAFNRKAHDCSVDSSGARDALVICTDGTWTVE